MRLRGRWPNGRFGELADYAVMIVAVVVVMVVVVVVVVVVLLLVVPVVVVVVAEVVLGAYCNNGDRSGCSGC